MISEESDQKKQKKLEHYIRRLCEEKKFEDFIDKMIEDELEDRIDSKEALLYLENEIKKNNYRNSNLGCLIRCLISFQNFNQKFSEIYNKIKGKEKPFSDLIYKCSLYNGEVKEETKTMELWITSINDFRLLLNSKIFNFEEINLDYALALIFYHLDKELSLEEEKNNYNEKDFFSYIEQPEQGEESQIYFENVLFSEYKSFIFKNFHGLIKYEEICDECQIKTFHYSTYLYMTINILFKSNISKVEQLISYINGKQEYKNDKPEYENVFYCKNCLEKQSHQIIKEFYSFPDSLIIYFNNQKEIVYNKEEINKSIELENIELKNEKFKLIACVEYCSKKRIFFPVFFNGKIWGFHLNQEFENCGSFSDNLTKGDEKIIKMLFYEKIK